VPVKVGSETVPAGVYVPLLVTFFSVGVSKLILTATVFVEFVVAQLKEGVLMVPAGV